MTPVARLRRLYRSKAMKLETARRERDAAAVALQKACKHPHDAIVAWDYKTSPLERPGRVCRDCGFVCDGWDGRRIPNAYGDKAYPTITYDQAYKLRIWTPRDEDED